VDEDVRRGLERAGKDAETGSQSHKTGEKIGHDVSDGIESSLKTRGRTWGEKIRALFGREKVKTKVDVDVDIDRHTLGAHLHEGLADAAREAYDIVNRPGGPFDSVGRGIADAIGAGFNVSGRSSLIGVLVPVIGAIADLIVGAIAGLQGVAALLLSLPTLLASIGIQAGILMVAFKGIGGAISKAFAANNAKELKAALFDLSPPARAFVLALLPLKNLLSDLKEIIMADFFRTLGTNIGGLIAKLGPILRFGVRDVSLALGTLVHDLIDFFQSPVFVKFLTDVFPLTVEWLKAFTPRFITFLQGLISVADALMPFLDKFGKLFAGEFEYFGTYLKNLARDPKFKQWMDDAYELTKSLFGLINAAGMFIASFVDAIVKNGGKDAIDSFTEGLEQLAFFFSTKEGQEGIKAFIDLVVALTYSFFGLIELFFILIGAFRDFFLWLGGVIGGFIDWLKEKWAELKKWLSDLFDGTAIMSELDRIKNAILDFFRPARFWLHQAGADLVLGFIDGMSSMNQPLRISAVKAVRQVTNQMPGSPAKEGPLSGSGYSYYRGQALVKDFAAGIHSEAQGLSSVTNQAMGGINFGPGSIRVGFNGATPTPEQARITGTAVGSGVADLLATRNTQLGVRML
jgi:hypothetical protein